MNYIALAIDPFLGPCYLLLIPIGLLASVPASGGKWGKKAAVAPEVATEEPAPPEGAAPPEAAAPTGVNRQSIGNQ